MESESESVPVPEGESLSEEELKAIQESYNVEKYSVRLGENAFVWGFFFPVGEDGKRKVELLWMLRKPKPEDEDVLGDFQMDMLRYTVCSPSKDEEVLIAIIKKVLKIELRVDDVEKC